MNRKMKHGLFKTLMLVGFISFVGCSDKEVELPVGDPRTPDLIRDWRIYNYRWGYNRLSFRTSDANALRL